MLHYSRALLFSSYRPISDSVYMQLKKESIIKASEPVRQTKRLDKAVVAYKPKSNHVSNIVFAAKKKEEGKMLRENKDIVRIEWNCSGMHGL